MDLFYGKESSIFVEAYRWELHHLLGLCGLAVEAEYSDFAGAAPAYSQGVDPDRAACVTVRRFDQ